METSPVRMQRLAGELYLALRTRGSFGRASEGALQRDYGTPSNTPVLWIARTLESSGQILQSSYLGGRDASGRVTSLEFLDWEITGDRILLRATTGEDAGTATDSLDPGRFCARGSRRILELALTLQETFSVACQPQ